MEIYRVEEALDTFALEHSLIRKVATRRERVKNLLKSQGRGPLTADDVMIAPDAPRLAFRRIARSTDFRTLICAIIPPQVFAGNTVIFHKPWYFSAQKALEQLHDIRNCYKSALLAPVLAYLL